MSRQLAFTGAIVLAFAAGAVSFTTNADAAVVRHHHIHRVAAHHGTDHRQVVRHYVHPGGPIGGVWDGDDWVADNGWTGGYYDGYGDYSRYGDDYCGTIEWTFEQCGPHGP